MIFEQNSNYFLIACNKYIYLDDSSLQGNPDHAIKKNPGKSKNNNFSVSCHPIKFYYFVFKMTISYLPFF